MSETRVVGIPMKPWLTGVGLMFGAFIVWRTVVSNVPQARPLGNSARHPTTEYLASAIYVVGESFLGRPTRDLLLAVGDRNGRLVFKAGYPLSRGESITDPEISEISWESESCVVFSGRHGFHDASTKPGEGATIGRLEIRVELPFVDAGR